MKHLFRSLFQAVCFVFLALIGLEGGLWVFHQGAFGEPNFYEDDEELGLRLIPNSKMRLSYLGVTPYTDIRINDQGFRGGPHPPPGENDVVVMGDSLTFGLGVNLEETFPALLQEQLGGDSVFINYGVPAYQMYEMNILLERILQERQPHHVIYAITVGRFLGRMRTGIIERADFDNGWLIAGGKGNVQVPLPLPGAVMRHSQIVNLIRQTMRDPPRKEFTRRIVQLRHKELKEKGKAARDERTRLENRSWFELVGSDGRARSWSQLMPPLRDLKKIMEGRASDLTLVILPQDVVLHDESWKKYDLEPADMSLVQFLTEDLVASASALGFNVLDTSDAIRTAGPKTTLPRDWHLSTLGHQVVAKEIADHFAQTASGVQANPVKIPSSGGVF